MYRVPAEFIRQKNTVFGPVTVAHVVGGVGGYLVSQVLGGGPWLLLACVAIGVLATTLQVQGLVLYEFAPLAAAYLYRRLTGETVDPDEEPGLAPATSTLVIRDAEGNPIVFQWEEK
jgi:cation transporter-like permease